MGKEDRNCIPRHLVTLVEDLDAWNDYPWGEYVWAKFYERTVNIVDVHRQHHLDEKKKNPNYNATYNLYGFAWAFTDSILIVNLDPTPVEKIQAWFDLSIPYFNGIVDEDGKCCGDDYVLVSKDNFLDEDCNMCEDASAGFSKDEIVNDKLVNEDCNVCDDASVGFSKDNAVNEKSVRNNDQLLLEDGDVLFDLEAYLNSNQTGVDQELGGAANDPMPDQMNDYNCSQPIPASMDALIQACAYAADHPELDVLQHEAHVDHFGPKINQHPTAEPLTPDEFQDDYMSVLNDEEMIPNVFLDDMKFQHEEENLPIKDTLEHQPVDELIDAQKDTTNLLPENVKLKSFLCYMRSVIIIDAAHLKGTYQGTNLVAVRIDRNSQIIPIATGVSQGETGESWTWYKALYWKTCKAYTEQEFDKLMSDIQAVRPDAHHKLVEAGIEKWSRAKCPANRYNYMTSNSAESINALTKEVRKIPITALMDWYRDRLRKWMKN
uniref:Transposase, MuDR, MULE transposase domain protein n=1 Tax=Tanacetum cinerariifolium TaxID=118510 RepID=A0A6L2JPH0_TANCI|nr:transposase, MuDR, MULE transposase domain protein [Tanacetum cinerariifolium]